MLNGRFDSILLSVLFIIAASVPNRIHSANRVQLRPSLLRLACQTTSSHIIKLSIFSIIYTLPTGISQVVEDEIQDEFLAEILAEEKKEAEELLKLEEEMRELEELKAQHDKFREEENTRKMKPRRRGTPSKGSRNLEDVEDESHQKAADEEEAKRKNDESDQNIAAKKKADEIAKTREAKYQAELEKIDDEKALKLLKQQKKRDSKIVKRILRNSANERHYSVLGLRCVPFKLGPLNLCNKSAGDIKRAYRQIARLVHPDKNRDGRAGEAFDALEKSSSLLLDPSKKNSYDTQLRKERKQTFDKVIVTIHNMWQSFRKIVKLLGPIATPVLILVTIAL